MSCEAPPRDLNTRFIHPYIWLSLLKNAFLHNPLKVVTNEKGEAVGEVLTIIC